MNNRYLKLGVGLVLGLSAIDASAVRATREPIQVTQPDGTVITVRLTGDERSHSTYTLDGELLLKDQEGYFCYATIGEDGYPVASTTRVKPFVRPMFESGHKEDVEAARIRKEAAQGRNPRFIFSGNAFPAYGEPRGLVVLVEYKDKAFSMSDPNAFFDNQLNGENYTQYGATGSARDYFIRNSNGIFKPHFDVLGPVKLPNNYSYYGKNVGYWEEDAHPEEMILESLKALDADNDFSVYDYDNDGYIDNVFVIYAGYGEADSHIENTVWPHSADLVDYDITLPTHDGVKPNRYAMTCELDYTYKRPDGIGTFVHEFSHVLGLPDLYHTTDPYVYYTPGAWSVLDYGPYNNQGRTPPAYSIHERYSLDWMTPEQLQYTGDYTLNPITATNFGYIIPTEKENEMFLIESRYKTGDDLYIPNSGMLVWHIDFDQSVWNDNAVNNNESHQYVDLIEADNKPDTSSGSSTASGDCFPGKNNVTSLSFTTTPSLQSWGKKSTGIEFSNIKLNTDGSVSFHIEGKESGIESVATTGNVYCNRGILYNEGEEACEVYDIAGRKIGRTAAGGTMTLPGTGLYIVANSEGVVKVMSK